jgi:hypothetical protein
MAGFLDQLAEARIRDWQRRVAAGEVSATEGLPLKGESWESQLFHEIVALRLAARESTDEAEAQALRDRAEGLRIQLMVALERDRPRLARILAARLMKV